MAFLLFQSNLYVVLAHGKGPKNRIQDRSFHDKKTPDPQLRFARLTVRG